jgi:hypothetical protein
MRRRCSRGATHNHLNHDWTRSLRDLYSGKQSGPGRAPSATMAGPQNHPGIRVMQGATADLELGRIGSGSPSRSLPSVRQFHHSRPRRADSGVPKQAPDPVEVRRGRAGFAALYPQKTENDIETVICPLLLCMAVPDLRGKPAWPPLVFPPSSVCVCCRARDEPRRARKARSSLACGPFTAAV